MKDKKFECFLGLIILISLIVFVFWFRIHEATNQSVEKKLNRIDQNLSHYVTDSSATLNLNKFQQSQLSKAFLRLYFAPWSDDINSQTINAQVLKKMQQDFEHFLEQPGWHLNKNPISKQNIKSLINNADLNDFPRINKPGIVLHNTEMRVFPTLLPSYGKPGEAGEGHPFDNWIESTISVGTPVWVLQPTKDHLWYLVRTDSFYGWAPSNDIGIITSDFITEWKKHPYLVALHDQVPLLTPQKIVLAAMHKGTLFPILHSDNQQYQVLVPFLDSNGQIKTNVLSANKAETLEFPIAANTKNIALLAQDFMGTVYGWGSLYELRDCSSTTQDLLAGFGIWLPRNSTQQGKMGEIISLANLNREKKRQQITKNGVPFFSIIHFPGHIALYIGTFNNKIYVLQDIWGLRTQNLFGLNGRAILGKTVIMPLDFSYGFSNVQKLQLDTADSISIFKSETYSKPSLIQEIIWK